MKHIDLRSDTVTWPTPEMRTAMAAAEVGDDVYGDDPVTVELEKYAASLAGKEAALFVPSGTFGNQLALFTHCPRGSEAILDEDCHIVQHEAGGAAVIAGVQLRAIACGGESLKAAEVQKRIRVGDDIHEPKTSLICIENAHSNGKAMKMEELQDLRRCADRFHIPVHMDGARLFNAASALGVQAREITQYADSVMFCLSKGLCAPAGSILAGSRKFIEEARRKRKIMGGGMRQTGILAAAGLVALKEMRTRLDEDHENARRLAELLAKIPGIMIAGDRLQINMVFFRHEKADSYDGEAFVEHMKERNILINPAGPDGSYRFVTHYWIKREHLQIIADAVKDFYTQD
ncbi:low-specificity L-threonine aldolase [Treponema zuelzerae]|uniref:Low-specificity L-threonine aldolase n=1 Tax=Teretinema zuelzerae TaxID=156 RepID=A0AAE3EGV4_9SPIR|nr:low-specificity L-threonine aldolase [Teretinema zuelzerae]MBN2811242.1 low-specificity L-threonine aldolase [Spirochaetales bacterium]MCD1653940.1 low-specificity L-threonine aldolase [Teretinema zuelzerae]HPO03693.1 low-specificity L-threonine aldolase [Treponemataceae bacterium]